MFLHSKCQAPAAAAAIAGLFAMFTLSTIAPASAADANRGRALYESRCDTCHTTSVHVRESRRASDFAGIRLQVERWNGQLGGAWRREDIDDVTVYLNDRFYRYPCPDAMCRSGAAQRRDGSGTSLAAGGRASSRDLRPRAE